MISVIVPLYNVEQYVGYCIESILAQTYKDFELILVDDGSIDNSFTRCQDYSIQDSRIRIIQQENAGVSAARNTGIENAKGEYIAFIDADDLVPQDYLDYLLSGMRSDVLLTMCSHARVLNYDYEFPAIQESFKILSAQESANRLLNGYFPVCVWGGLFKRSLIGDLRFKVGVRNNEDKLFLYQYLLKNENGLISFSNEKRYGYMVREGSAARQGWNGNLDVVKVADQMLEETEKTHPEWRAQAEYACLSARLKTMNSILRAGKTTFGDQVYEQLKEEVLAYGFPKKGSKRLKIEYLAVKLGKPVYRALVSTYYRVYNDEKSSRLNEMRIRQ